MKCFLLFLIPWAAFTYFYGQKDWYLEFHRKLHYELHCEFDYELHCELYFELHYELDYGLPYELYKSKKENKASGG